MDTLNFNFVFLGQSILRYKTPIYVQQVINHVYESKLHQLPPANKQLVGKINNEHSIFYNGEDETKVKKHNMLPSDVLHWFNGMFEHYLKWNKIKEYDIRLNSIWVNEMKEHEYNPVHIHQGSIFTGLSSVMILKLPKSFGVEYSAADQPQNGRLQILGSASGQFSKIDYQPEVKVGDFFIFPYDMRHCVYPFNGPETRRTLAANCDVQYNSVQNRGIE
jgi:hypothetical protein|tara:strand:+ start:119 stop:775 length:657 start_codon:yes stop_codon:yes gene_type:complete